MDYTTITIRILITLFASIAFGINRQKAHKPIGFGTYTYVSAGTCAIAIAALTLAQGSGVATLGILGAALTGVGFLGAGALVKNNDKTFGFTTASGIWVFAIFGILIGTGEYMIASVIYGIVWVIILIDSYLEDHGLGSYMKKLTIKTNMIISERELRELIHANTSGSKLMHMNIDKKESKLTFVYQIEGSKEEINKIPNTLYQKEWFESCQID